eukprot:gene40148-63988_t
MAINLGSNPAERPLCNCRCSGNFVCQTTLAALATLPSLITTPLASAAGQPLLQALKPSPRLPVLFVGHGSPMNAIEDNAWRR